jgi:hypothetical protein
MTISRRHALAAALGAAAACGGARRPVAPNPPAVMPPLHIDPLVDLVTGAELVWLVQIRPQAMLGDPTLARATETLIPATRLRTFAEDHGGVDLRRAGEIVVAGYPETILALAAVDVDADRVERSFSEHAAVLEGRTAERGITRAWGLFGATRTQLAVFGRGAVAVERGRLGPLRAAVSFAEGRLKRSAPALRAEPLAAAAERLGAAPLRAFAPGPFNEQWGAGLGGLLRATTAAAVGLQASGTRPGAVKARLVLTGAWGDAAQAAGQRLSARFDLIADDPLGRLTGLDRPVTPAQVRTDPAALELDVVLDTAALSEGLRSATSSALAEIFAL